MGERAEQLVLEYLGRVADASHGVLRSDHRVAFVARLRARIDELRADATEPEEVRKVIARFGDPVKLVERERERLARAAAERAAPEPPSERTTPEQAASEWVGRSWSAHERHAAGRPPPAPAPVPEDEPSTDPIPVIRPEDEAHGPPQPPQTAAQQPAPPAVEPAAEPNVRPAAEQAIAAETPGRHGAAGHIRPVPGKPSTPQARPTHAGLPLYEPPSPRRARADLSSLGSRLLARLPPEAWSGLRSQVLAPIAVAILGVGGLLLPFPLWLLGAALVVLSAEWPRRHQLVGLLLPVAFLLGGAGALAALDGNRAGAAAYGHALVAHGPDLFRVGAAIGAAFLAWRVLAKVRGPGPPRWREAHGRRDGSTRGFR